MPKVADICDFFSLTGGMCWEEAGIIVHCSLRLGENATPHWCRHRSNIPNKNYDILFKYHLLIFERYSYNFAV